LWFLDGLHRDQNMRSIAGELDLKFVGEVGYPDGFGLGNFMFFHKGTKKEFQNLMSGMLGNVRVVVFDYSYENTEIKGRLAPLPKARSEQTVIILKLPNANLPKFTLYPRTKFANLTKFFDTGSKKSFFINLSKFSKFSRRYVVITDNRNAEAGFSKKMGKFFEGHSDFSAQSHRGYLLLYKKDEFIHARNLKNVVLEASQMFELFAQAY